MSNRQARREQSKSSRTQRTGQRQPSRGSTGGSSKPSRSSNPLTQPFVLGIIALVVVLGGILAFFVIFGDDDEQPFVAELEAGRTPTDLPWDGVSLGNADAPMTLAMYEDFQCPFCLAFTADDKPTIVEEYVRTGKLRIEFHNFPILGEESTTAAIAGFCAAEQNQFWAFHDELFLIQARAGQGAPGGEENNVGRFSDGELKGVADQLGLDRTQFDQCLLSQDALEAVEGQVADARAFGFSGTPSFLLNDQPLSTGDPGSIENWRTVLDAAYDAVSASPTPSASETPDSTGTPDEAVTPEETATP